MVILTLSIKQPWAWLIVHGYKDVENRTWPTKIRGPINVHAGKTFDREGYDWVRQAFPEIPLPLPKEFLKGGIVGQVRITDCVKDLESPWFFGPYGFTLSEAKPVPLIPYKGQQRFFEFKEVRR